MGRQVGQTNNIRDENKGDYLIKKPTQNFGNQ
jgi:hypothetical protein